MPDATPPSLAIRRRRFLAAGTAAIPGLLPHVVHGQSGPGTLTNDLLANAKKEGKVTFYTTDDEALATQLAKGFQAANPGIEVVLVRAGAETLLKRITDEQKAGQWQADVLTTNDLRSLVMFRRNGWLMPYIPDPVRRWPEPARDAAGFYAIQNVTLLVMGFNTKQVTAEQAPKSYEDLLTRRWQGKLVKLHPGEAGDGLISTFLLNRELGWSFWERLAQQQVLQVNAGTDAAAKLASGERWAMVDGTEQAALRLRASGAPIGIVHAKEGTPIAPSGTTLFKEAPHPNAARMLVDWLMEREAQQIVVNAGGRSYHPDVKDGPDRQPFASLKLLTADPILLAAESDLIKQIYEQFFPK